MHFDIEYDFYRIYYGNVYSIIHVLNVTFDLLKKNTDPLLTANEKYFILFICI